MKQLRDKIMLRGVGSLTDAELLAVVIDDVRLAERLVESVGSLAALSRMDLSRLRMAEGLGLQRAEKVAVAAELGRRLARAESMQTECVLSSDDALRLLRPHFEGLTREECRVLFLTSSNRVVECMLLSTGGVQATVVDHRLIVKRALELLATQIIVAHNHPSGSASPSEPDKELTRRIKEAAALFDIALLDHIIIASSGETFSFKGQGLL